ncbi:hypothetical protein CVT26_007986 [Gymnopilus dilepis]|uniref:Uncharacterized protein n=1 Tax=Gymnopilus dilepis TaxID=231916 RepID=A0A409W7N1_9AGAR|nr:hypothetical protein CVT26_007986 [Gymnopilus dilepis]
MSVPKDLETQFPACVKQVHLAMVTASTNNTPSFPKYSSFDESCRAFNFEGMDRRSSIWRIKVKPIEHIVNDDMAGRGADIYIATVINFVNKRVQDWEYYYIAVFKDLTYFSADVSES